MTTTINADTVTGGAIITGDASGELGLQTAGTTRMTITSAGNVGVGTTTPNKRFSVISGGSTQFTVETAAGANDTIKFDTYNGSAIKGIYTWSQQGTEAMRIDSSGNVGIGTSSPSYPLVVSKADTSSTVGASSSSFHIVNTDSAAFGRLSELVFNVVNQASGSAMASISGQYATYGGSYGGNLLFSTNAGSGGSVTERMRIKSDGEVLIAGTTDQGAYNLQVAGTGVWGAGAYVNGSDARIKDNIEPLQSGLDVVAKLRPVTFQYKKTWDKDISVQPGFIAQDLQEALSDTGYVDGVVKQGPEYLNVSYQTLIPLLTKAIQELKSEVDSLKSQLKGA